MSKDVASLFKLFIQQVKTYHQKSQYFTGIKTFWVIDNNLDVLNSIRSLSCKKRAKQVSTYDFSTLYTKIPHEKLLEVLTEIVEFCFRGRSKDPVEVDNYGKAYWCRNKKSKNKLYYKCDVIQGIDFLLKNCYFNVGHTVMRQVVGLPMGGDPAPFWANLFLFFYEFKWVKKMKQSNNVLARKFTNTFRFIDDLIAINDNGMFEQYHQEIYPKELVLKKENEDEQKCTFLDIEIKIEENKFKTKLYDKRDDYKFKIVRLPYLDSNIPKKMFLSSIAAEILRIARVTSCFTCFRTSASTLLKRMISQGAYLPEVRSSVQRLISNHWEDFDKFSIQRTALVNTIFTLT